MEITKVSRKVVFSVETDETDDGNIYHRDSEGNWTYRVGESDEIMYDNKLMELLFHDFIFKEYKSEVDDFIKKGEQRPPYFKNELQKQAFIRLFHCLMSDKPLEIIPL